MLVFVFASGLSWVGWDFWSGLRYRRVISEVKAAMAAKRYAAAASNLAAVLAWRPGSDEAAYLLGACELLRGRSQSAADAWARVANGSAYSERAILARMRLLYDSGQIEAAEHFLKKVAREPGNDPTAVRLLLLPIYRQLGRIEEAARLVEERWDHLDSTGEGTTDPAVNMIRLHVELTSTASPDEGTHPHASQTEKKAAPAGTAKPRAPTPENGQWQARYRRLHARKQPIRDAVEMAVLAERLGRSFEARAFRALALAVNPDRDALRRNLAWLDNTTLPANPKK